MMNPTVILPYTSKRTTTEDVEAIRKCLYRHKPQVRLLAYDYKQLPPDLMEPFPKQTITVTLNAYRPSPSSVFKSIPGPKFFARKRSKSELFEDILWSGVKVPHTEKFSSDMSLDHAKFGPYIAIKTTIPGTARGKGIYVFRTKEFDALREKLRKLFKDDMAAGHPPILQQYVNTGPNPMHTRVTTFLGAPLMCFQTSSPTAFNVSKISGLVGGEATSNFNKKRIYKLSYDEEMISMSKIVCATMPETSVHSIDMVRCVETGTAYCIENNMGNLCVLSAPICSVLRKALGKDAVRRQFGAYETIARRMIETLDEVPAT